MNNAIITFEVLLLVALLGLGLAPRRHTFSYTKCEFSFAVSAQVCVDDGSSVAWEPGPLVKLIGQMR